MGAWMDCSSRDIVVKLFNQCMFEASLDLVRRHDDLPILDDNELFEACYVLGYWSFMRSNIKSTGSLPRVVALCTKRRCFPVVM